MKDILLIMAANLIPITCVGIGGYLAANSLDGWGWFLFVALFSCTCFSTEVDEDDQDNNNER